MSETPWTERVDERNDLEKLFDAAPNKREKAILLVLATIARAHQQNASMEFFIDLLDASCKVIQHASEVELLKFLLEELKNAPEERVTQKNILNDLALVGLRLADELIKHAEQAKRLSLLIHNAAETPNARG